MNNNLRKNYQEFSPGLQPFLLIQKNYDSEEMTSSINNLIKKNIKLKFKKSEREISVFNNLAKKNSNNVLSSQNLSCNLSQRNLVAMIPPLEHNLEKYTKELQKS